MYPSLKTGDLIFFDEHPSGCLRLLTSFIKCCTCSKYSHCAMVYVARGNEKEIADENGYELRQGFPYVMESTVHSCRCGVQMTTLKYYQSRATLYVRRVDTSTDVGDRIQRNALEKYLRYNSYCYDPLPCDWFSVWTKCGCCMWRHSGRLHNPGLFCSAFVGRMVDLDNWEMNSAKDVADAYIPGYGSVEVLDIRA